ncbi:GNAT family N-acetyltransferase [Rothia koreensis]|uniref:GNAT family N-acetyltransferase n=1 Tax=Rothia koreensis TaxID=592378 RepID=UPI003F221E30
MPPLTEQFQNILDFFSSENCFAVGLRLPVGRLVAAGRVTKKTQQTAYLSRLCVAPDCQGRGLGSLLLEELEKNVGDRVCRLELATGARSRANLHFYQSHGYVEYERIALPAGYSEVHLMKCLDRQE